MKVSKKLLPFLECFQYITDTKNIVRDRAWNSVFTQVVDIYVKNTRVNFQISATFIGFRIQQISKTNS